MTDPARCVYVGDRLFDDVWGAQNAGCGPSTSRTALIPPDQVGHSEGTPDAVAQRLVEIPGIVAAWRVTDGVPSTAVFCIADL